MQRIIQVNIGGRSIPMEDEAYLDLKNYLDAIQHHFHGVAGKSEIIEDIEARISELFQIAITNGATTITTVDVGKVKEMLGAPHILRGESDVPHYTGLPNKYESNREHHKSNHAKKLYRKNDQKMIAGVCVGLADYFKVDPVIIRVVFLLAAFFALGGVIAYIVLWAILPVATNDDISNTQNSPGFDFNNLEKNITKEMKELERKAEQMSRDLQEWFKKRK